MKNKFFLITLIGEWIKSENNETNLSYTLHNTAIVPPLNPATTLLAPIAIPFKHSIILFIIVFYLS